MYEKTINEKVYQMSASVSENAKTLLLGMDFRGDYLDDLIVKE